MSYDPSFGTAEVGGSHGNSDFDLHAGWLEHPYGEAPGPLLVRVDLREWELAYGRMIEPGDHFDVLDLAGWNSKGEWMDAEEDWRDDWIADYFFDGFDTPQVHADVLWYLTFGREAVKRHEKRRTGVRGRVEGAEAPK